MGIVRRRYVRLSLATAFAGALLAAACGTFQGLDDYEKVDCLGDGCDASIALVDVAAPDTAKIDPVVDAGADDGDALTDASDENVISGASSIGGIVAGLVGSGLEVQLNGAEKLTIASNGIFKFATTLLPGATYATVVAKQPTNPTQTCNVSGGSGTVGASDITTIVVNCDPDKHTVGGTVTGLSVGSVYLKNNGADIVEVGAASDGSPRMFTFPTPLSGGADYAITVATQPVGLTCVVSSGSGKVGTTDVSDVAITCTKNGYSVGGTLFGVTGSIALRNNGGNQLTTSTNGSFTFSQPVLFGAGYDVTVGTQPAGQTCTVANGKGTMGAFPVENVTVTCTTVDAGSSCGPTNTTTNCSACGATCDTTFSNTASCNGTTCAYASCKPGRYDCNTSAPNTNGCECASSQCCVGGAAGQPGPTATCAPQHNDGVGQAFFDCAGVGAYSQDLAMKACTAFTGDVTKCAASQCVGVAGGKFGIVCSSGASTCTCWNYEGTLAGYVRVSSTTACYCAGSSSYPTWQ